MEEPLFITLCKKRFTLQRMIKLIHHTNGRLQPEGFVEGVRVRYTGSGSRVDASGLARSLRGKEGVMIRRNTAYKELIVCRMDDGVTHHFKEHELEII